MAAVAMAREERERRSRLVQRGGSNGIDGGVTLDDPIYHLTGSHLPRTITRRKSRCSRDAIFEITPKKTGERVRVVREREVRSAR